MVITGSSSKIKNAFEGGFVSGVEHVYNPDWPEGMSSSIRLGCQLLASDCDQILVLLSDQFWYQPMSLVRLWVRRAAPGSRVQGLADGWSARFIRKRFTPNCCH